MAPAASDQFQVARCVDVAYRPLVRPVWWHRTWYAPCNDVTTKNVEFARFEVPKGSTDRLMSVPLQPAKFGNAMRVEVRHGEWGWNPDANGGAGAQIQGGWRAEANGPTEPKWIGATSLQHAAK